MNLFTVVFAKSSESKQKSGLFDEFEKCLDEYLKSNGKVSEAWSTFYDNVTCDLIPKEADNRSINAVRKWCNSFTSYSNESQSNVLITIKDIISGNWNTTLEQILGKLIRFVEKVWLCFASKSDRDEAKSWAEYLDEKIVLKKVLNSQIYKCSNSNENANNPHLFALLKENIDRIPRQKSQQSIHNRDI